MKYLLISLIATVLFLTGCSQGRMEAQMSAKRSADAAQRNPMEADAANQAVTAAADGLAPMAKAASLAQGTKPRQLLLNRMVIRTATLTIRVDDVEKAEREVDRIVETAGGYVGAASSSDLASDHPMMSLTMRVPVASFEEIMAKLEALGVRISKSIQSDDVTEQVVDLDAQIKTLQAQEDTFRNILKQSRDLNSVIELQEKLTEVRSQIESIAGQRKSLAGAAAFSTITLQLQQSAVVNQAPKDPNWLAQTWGESTSSMAGVVRGAASYGIWLFVFSPIWLPLAWFAWKAVRTSLPKKQPEPVGQS